MMSGTDPDVGTFHMAISLSIRPLIGTLCLFRLTIRKFLLIWRFPFDLHDLLSFFWELRNLLLYRPFDMERSAVTYWITYYYAIGG